MARRTHAYAENVPGTFFVDDSCIDCDTCRQVAPLIFVEVAGHSAVQVQPEESSALEAAALAAIACPVDAIGGDASAIRAAAQAFPQRVSELAWYCGWTSRHSFGASSWLLRTPAGLLMIDSPRWSPQLATAIERMGGLAGIFLTHRDDIADAARWAERFHAPRWIHARDADAHPAAEHWIEGDDPLEILPGATAIPTPGHTAGSWCLHHADHLFTGDHLWWSRNRQRLTASKDYCWHDWDEQIASVKRLRRWDFAHLLPGHGERRQGTVASLRADLDALIATLA